LSISSGPNDPDWAVPGALRLADGGDGQAAAGTLQRIGFAAEQGEVDWFF